MSIYLVFYQSTEFSSPPVTSSNWSPTFHRDFARTGYSNSSGPLTNHTLWAFSAQMDIEYSSPAIVDDVVYFGSNDRRVYAVNATTGEKIWSYLTGGSVESSCTVVDGVVYFGSHDDNVYAVDAITGKKVWSYSTNGDVYSTPAVVDGVLYVGSTDDKVYALDAASGREIWSYSTSNSVWSSPAVVNGVVYVNSHDTAYALDALMVEKSGVSLLGDPFIPLQQSSMTGYTLAQATLYIV